MDKYLNKVVLIEVWAEAWNSGNYKKDYAFVPVELYDQFKDDIEEHTAYFNELDGKHSEVEGTIEISYITTQKGLIAAYLENQDNETDQVVDDMGFFNKEQRASIQSLTNEIMNQFTSEVTTVVKFNGEVV